jgi:molecular chaperone DnaJ
MECPYDVLEVDRGCTAEELKRAYRRLALLHHPDKNPADPGRFTRINAAYAVLSDEDKRRHYDLHGTVDPPPLDFAQVFKDIFADLPQGFFGHQQRAGEAVEVEDESSPPPKPEVVDVPVALADIVHGCHKLIEYEALDACPSCGKDVCAACGGRGVQHLRLGFMTAVSTCSACGGRRAASAKDCQACGSARTVYVKKSFDLHLPAGLPDGHVHVLKAQGSYDVDARAHRDLLLRFAYEAGDGCSVDPDTRDVHLTLPVTLEEVLCGFDKQVAPYGERSPPVPVRTQAYANPSRPIVFARQGLPAVDGGPRSDLVVHLEVAYPPEGRYARFHEFFCRIFGRRAATATAAAT